MPPFALDNAEMAGIIAYLRNMNAFDTATVKTGDAARGRAVFDGKGGCTELPPRRRAGSRVAPEPERHRRRCAAPGRCSARCSTRPAR